MKSKTSMTLSEDLLEEMDRYSDRFRNRSYVIESAVRAFLSELARGEQNAPDLEINNRNVARLDREACT
jgi:metal-responsive CopG/Arc/MetJ family transcriptional regulator